MTAKRLPKLRKDVKAKWLAALRSGEYKQGRHYLARNDQYCCLGVLCEVAIKDGLDLKKTQHYGVKSYGVTRNDMGLPREVVEYAFWKKRRPSLSSGDAMVNTEDGRQRWLSTLNDNGVSFAEIADAIERDL